MWVGRFLGWKHPELAVKLAERLKASGRTFTLKMIGTGECYDGIARMIDAKNLNDCVTMTGVMGFEQVRTEMEKAQIFLFTSDYHEGWGAVLNESMSSGCAVAAGSEIGAVPFLIKNNHNGIIFKDKNIDDLTEKVQGLLSSPSRISELGRNAYDTMISEWSPKIVAEHFVTLSDALMHGRSGNIFTEGPCSPAPLMRDNWFTRMN